MSTSAYEQGRPGYTGPPTEEPPPPTSRVEAWLRAGVPLSLLLDLCDPSGPHSRELFETEGCRGSAARLWRAQDEESSLRTPETPTSTPTTAVTASSRTAAVTASAVGAPESSTTAAPACNGVRIPRTSPA